MMSLQIPASAPSANGSAQNLLMTTANVDQASKQNSTKPAKVTNPQK